MAESVLHRSLLRDDLATAISARRDEVSAGVLADELLSRDDDGYVFVGVTAGATRVVYHQPHEWAIRSVGLEDGEIGTLHTGAFEAEFVHRPADYVAAQGAGAWAWLHPRFWWALRFTD